MANQWSRLVGGDLALDFVNTDLVSEDDRSTDVLRSVEEFLAWCAHAGVTSASAPVEWSDVMKRAFLREAVDVRVAIRNIVQAVIERRDADGASLVSLQSAYSAMVAQSAPTLDGRRLAWTSNPTSPRDALAELVGAAVDLLRHGPVDRLKACPACGFVFLDSTKNGSRRWCSMEDCGTQQKMRRYITKRAGARTRS